MGIFIHASVALLQTFSRDSTKFKHSNHATVRLGLSHGKPVFIALGSGRMRLELSERRKKVESVTETCGGIMGARIENLLAQKDMFPFERSSEDQYLARMDCGFSWSGKEKGEGVVSI